MTDFLVETVSSGIDCPKQLDSAQVAPLPAEQKQFTYKLSPRPHLLTQVRVYYGDPQNKIELSPAYTITQNGARLSWDLSSDRAGPEQIVVQCEYSETSEVLEKTINPDVNAISVYIASRL
jgi:hypothetical protein